MPDTITASPELISIIERNFESKGLDYKGPMEWSATDKKSCCELTKDVIAFANTEKMEQIFSAFFTTKPQGSGMGLAICRSIIERHGGRMWATANDGHGATFHFTLPTAVEEVKVPATGA